MASAPGSTLRRDAREAPAHRRHAARPEPPRGRPLRGRANGLLRLRTRAGGADREARSGLADQPPTFVGRLPSVTATVRVWPFRTTVSWIWSPGLCESIAALRSFEDETAWSSNFVIT